MGLFDSDYEAPKTKKLPTLKQWEKTLPKESKAFGQNFLVDIIWLPSTFPNLTIQTHKFRISLSNDHPAFKDLIELFESGKYEEVRGIYVKILDRETLGWKFSPANKKNGSWEKLSDTGYRFKLN